MDCLSFVLAPARSLSWALEGKAQEDNPWERRQGRPAYACRSSEAALLSASDRSGFEGALYGFAGALQGLRARSVHLTGLLRNCSRRALHRLAVLHRIGEAVVVRIHLDHFELGDRRIRVRDLDRHRRQHLTCDLLRRSAASVEGEDAVVRIAHA